MLHHFRLWRMERVRLVEFANWYFRWTPSFGIGTPWFRSKRLHRPQRLRMAKHHGVQVTEWRGARWVVVKQLLGCSTVIGESFDLPSRGK